MTTQKSRVYERIAELEATVRGLESDNGELSDRLSQSEALRLDAEQAAQAIVTPNTCRHCQRAAEQMRDAAAVVALSIPLQFYDTRTQREISKAINTLPLPACDGCNPLKPE